MRGGGDRADGEEEKGEGREEVHGKFHNVEKREWVFCQTVEIGAGM